MSINVTVSGNPVRIKRGTMVTAYDPAKSEFEKRRLIRLEQVRQQSKDIAENVRNKLKKEKAKCLSKIEEEGEIKLKNWQARKLLELHNQYQEALDEIGVGQKEAVRTEEEDEIFLEQQQSSDKIAKERGRVAAERLQIDKNEENLKKALPVQRKKLTRDVENTRSSAITSLRKVTQRKNSSKIKKKRYQQSYDSDSENRVPKLFDLEDTLSSSSLGADNPVESSVHKTSKEQQTSQTHFQSLPKSDKAAQTFMQEEAPVSTTQEVPLDTRISEHIKRRSRINQHLDYCDFADKELPPKIFNTHCTCCQCPLQREVTNRIPEQSEEAVFKPSEISTESRKLVKTNQQPLEVNGAGDKFSQQPIGYGINKQYSQQAIRDTVKPFSDQPTRDAANRSHNPMKESINLEESLKATSHVQRNETEVNDLKGEERIPDKSLKENKRLTKYKEISTANIPNKPRVTLQSSKDRIAHISVADPNSHPVQYYDHPNRFSKQYIPSSSHVEKINEDSLVISPNMLSEEDVREKMRQRDIEAHVRGQVALEKERIQREYRELLKKLPALQKQERIYEIGADKEKYHMSRDRLEEMERKRQNRLDNAYEELFVRRKPATVTLSKRKEEEAPSLNLASWEVDFDPVDTSNKSRAEQLNALLSNLKAQKDNLLKEIENTLSKETITELTKNSYDDVKSKSTDYSQKPQRKRSREERPYSPISSDINIGEDTESRSKSTKKGTSVSTVTSPSPRKKARLKSKKKVLILQNSSTQTTPKTGQSAATSPVTMTPVTDDSEKYKCSCPKETLDDVCEIVIKIKEDEKPEVTVNPSTLGKNVKVITDSIHERGDDCKEDNSKRVKSKETSTSKDESVKSKKSTVSTKSSLKTSSWKESLSQSASSQSTSSTSYFEPPSRPVGVSKTTNKPNSVEEIWKNSTLPDGSKRLDPRLLTYIKKLLNMSRASIDELTVSAASDVSTPSESMVETSANNPLIQLKNVMKYFNLDMAELQKQLNYCSDDSSLHYNTTESVTVSSNTSEGGKSVQFKSCTEIDSADKKENNNKLLKYADIAASCTKKISNLTAMIERVREEKKKILQSPPTSSTDSDKDISKTSYLGLPSAKKDDEDSSTSTQEDFDKKLLTIDYSYAERLKRLTDEEIQMEKKRSESQNPSEHELLTKFKNLLQDNSCPKACVVQEKTSVVLNKPEEVKKDERKTEELSPLFLDIPKLPRLETPTLEDEKKKKRPPPSKGFRTLGGPILLIPHELSTIIEADSQLSTKVESPVKPTSPKTSSDSKSSSIPDILTEVPPHKESKSQSNNSSDDISEMETMETMLISIGMEWAIPTLKKTREALALSSSSGSGSKKDSGEVSLREFLSRISSSNSTSGSMVSDSQSQGISLIEVDNRRTSTPILEGPNKERQPVFPTDSDISSVREQSNDGSKTG